MLELYGIDLDHLPHRKSDIREFLMPDYYKAWKEQHRNLRDEHLAGSGLAGLWLLQYAGYHGTLTYDAMGRPCLQGRQLDFNITHTSRMSFCAIGTPDQPGAVAEGEGAYAPWRVGIDAEDLRRIASLRTCPMAQRWFTRAEFDAFVEEPTDLHFLQIWTRKEALVKWLGSGLRTMRQTDTETAYERYGVRFRQYMHGHTVVTLCYCEGETPPDSIKVVSYPFPESF